MARANASGSGSGWRPGRGSAVRGELLVEVDEDGAGQVAAVVGGAAGAAVEVVADVGEHGSGVRAQPREVDDRRVRGGIWGFPLNARTGAGVLT